MRELRALPRAKHHTGRMLAVLPRANEPARARSSPMFIDIILARSQITELLSQFAPVRIHLASPDEDRSWVELDEPREITLLEGRGLRVVCTGRIRYAVAGLKVPLEIRRVQLLLEPRVVERVESEPRLEF